MVEKLEWQCLCLPQPGEHGDDVVVDDSNGVELDGGDGDDGNAGDVNE